jgi:hypothetical protein
MTPNFFVGIGAQKCASTWLYDVLSDHPEVALSQPKELDFFSYHYHMGYQWYERHWERKQGILAFGEISPSYFCEPAVPARILEYAPSALILLSLRDPVERAISNHLHEVRLGNLRGADLCFETGLKNNPMYLEQSRYGKHLQRWLEVFPKSRVLVVFTEDIVSDGLAVATSVQTFLGVDHNHRSKSLTKRSNEGHVHRYAVIEQSRKAARRLIGRLGLDPLWTGAQTLGLQSLYRRLNRRPTTHLVPSVSPESRDRLRRVLRDDIKLLEDITGRSLEAWLPDHPRG